MKELETILEKENYDFKVIEQISDGETSHHISNNYYFWISILE